jgi:hypothetical protein
MRSPRRPDLRTRGREADAWPEDLSAPGATSGDLHTDMVKSAEIVNAAKKLTAGAEI